MLAAASSALRRCRSPRPKPAGLGSQSSDFALWFRERVKDVSGVDLAEPPEGGPELVVTNLAVLDFEPGTDRMRLKSAHPGVMIADIVRATGFELVIPDLVPETDIPTEHQLDLLRTVIDPHGRRLKHPPRR